MKIVIGADHRGLALKEEIKKSLQEEIDFIDVGAFEPDADDDYPDIATAVVKKMRTEPDVRGILVCGSGVGVCVAANAYEDIRCGIGFNQQQVVAAVTDDHMNVLALSADYLDARLVPDLIRSFVYTTFSKQERHLRRIQKIQELKKDA